MWVNKIAITNGPAAQRGTYVGTIRTNGTSTVDWSLGGAASGGTEAKLHVWNAFNRVLFTPLVQDSTASWTYNSTTWRGANGSSTMRISMVRGLDEDGIEAFYQVSLSGGASGDAQLGIGLDSTSSPVGIRPYFSMGALTAAAAAIYSGIPGLGQHYVNALERQVTTVSAATFFSNSNGGYGGLMGTFKA